MVRWKRLLATANRRNHAQMSILSRQEAHPRLCRSEHEKRTAFTRVDSRSFPQPDFWPAPSDPSFLRVVRISPATKTSVTSRLPVSDAPSRHAGMSFCPTESQNRRRWNKIIAFATRNMSCSQKSIPGTEVKIFDPRDCSTGSPEAELLDSTVVQRNRQWWMYLAGQPRGFGATDIFSASLAAEAPLSVTGWKPTRDATGELVPVAGQQRSRIWDGNGGRHCPSYVKGWDPCRRAWVERIYNAGAADNLWGPYTIGFLEWNGKAWMDQSEAAFIANEDWERGSVYEPNLIYHDGKWKMWYVAGSNHEDYLIHGCAESGDGATGWSKHAVFAGPEMKMFDFCVRQRGTRFDAIFARVWVGHGAPSPETGLWWCSAEHPARILSE